MNKAKRVAGIEAASLAWKARGYFILVLIAFLLIIYVKTANQVSQSD